jgi:hypothetical protein
MLGRPENGTKKECCLVKVRELYCRTGIRVQDYLSPFFFFLIISVLRTSKVDIVFHIVPFLVNCVIIQ